MKADKLTTAFTEGGTCLSPYVIIKIMVDSKSGQVSVWNIMADLIVDYESLLQFKATCR